MKFELFRARERGWEKEREGACLLYILLTAMIYRSQIFIFTLSPNIGDDKRSVSSPVLPSAERTIKYVKLYGARCYWVAAT